MLEERRIVFSFGVTYDTTPEQAEAIPAVVHKLVESHENLRFHRAPTSRPFGANSLDYEVVYIVRTDLRRLHGYAAIPQSGLDARTQALGVGSRFRRRTVRIAPAAIFCTGPGGPSPTSPDASRWGAKKPVAFAGDQLNKVSCL